MSRSKLAHLVLIVVGLVILAYPLTIGAHPQVACRGVLMRPGDSCAKADQSGAQSYEQLVATKRSARPVVAVVGALVVAFGVTLLVSESRRREPPGRPQTS